jgi:hypothetical protein
MFVKVGSKPGLAAVLVLGLLAAAPAQAFDGQEIIDRLDGAWTGKFQWADGTGLQFISVYLETPYFGEDGQVFVSGETEYALDGEVTVVSTEWQIMPETGRVEIFDLPGKNIDPESFETDGSYVGYLSKDMTGIKAVWTTRSTGEQGTLQLEALGLGG